MQQLDQDKFQNAVLFILRQSATRPGMTSLLKMLYFADNEHYRAYLTPITGANYVALPNGPVIDNYRSLFDSLVRDGILTQHEVAVWGTPRKKVEFETTCEPNLAVFTKSELDVLATIVAECGTATGSALSERTHREGPWTWAWDPSAPGRPIPYTLFRWLDNLPDDEDIDVARDRLAQDDALLARVRHLNSTGAFQSAP